MVLQAPHVFTHVSPPNPRQCTMLALCGHVSASSQHYIVTLAIPLNFEYQVNRWVKITHFESMEILNIYHCVYFKLNKKARKRTTFSLLVSREIEMEKKRETRKCVCFLLRKWKEKDKKSHFFFLVPLYACIQSNIWNCEWPSQICGVGGLLIME